MSSETINLPETIDGWKLEGPPKRVDAEGIFDYMNGAGELYLAYHFDHLLVYEYKDGSENGLLVEIYVMRAPRDAFGLLSLDWGGEAIEFGPHGEDLSVESVVPTARAMYGQGLLRAWLDNLYVRILAFRESEGVREVILRLGRMIAAGRENPAPPEFLRVLEASNDSPWRLRKDRTAYFYSHLVLNSLFYLSHENILNLGPSTEAVIATLTREKGEESRDSVRLLAIGYPDDERASAALDGFSKVYLPDKIREAEPRSEGLNQGFFLLEDGWLGYKLGGRHLVLAFGCPEEASARDILSLTVLE